MFVLFFSFWIFPLWASWTPTHEGWSVLDQETSLKNLCPHFPDSDFYLKNASPEKDPLCLYWAFLKKAEALKRPFKKKERKRKKTPRITPDNVLKVDLPFRSAVKAFFIPKEKSLIPFLKKLKGTRAICRHPDVSAAFLERLETFLPKEYIYESMLTLYQDLKTCLKVNTKAYHRVHMLMGFLALSRKKLDLASDALHRAARFSHPDLEPVLFWLGLIQKKRSGQSFWDQDPPAWTQLLDTYPYNYYSILIHQLKGQDPFLNGAVSGRPVVLSSAWGNTLIDRATRLVRLLLDANEKERAYCLSDAIWTVGPQFESSSQAYGLALAFSDARFYLGTISYLNRGRFADADPRLPFKLFRKLFPFGYDSLINEKKKTHLDTNVILALMRRESAFDPRALSPAKAAGLMQVIPGTAKKYDKKANRKKLFDPQTSIVIGTQHLEKLRKEHGDLPLILAAYNAGDRKPTEWKKRYPVPNSIWMPLIPYRETREYVSAIMGSAYWYGRLRAKLSVEPFLSQLTAGLLDRFFQTQKVSSYQSSLDEIRSFYGDSL